MKKKLFHAYKQKADLANLAHRAADQAMHSRDAGEITDREYYVFLSVFHRVHTSYAIELKEIENKIENKDYTFDIFVGVVLLGLIAAWIWLL
jgi:hypothetical protein